MLIIVVNAEARKMLENSAESHQSSARFVGTLFDYKLLAFYLHAPPLTRQPTPIAGHHRKPPTLLLAEVIWYVPADI